MKFRRKEQIEATQWMKEGDHPAVVKMDFPSGESFFGMVVPNQGFMKVNPGDYIMTVTVQPGNTVAYQLMPKNMFEMSFEPVV